MNTRTITLGVTEWDTFHDVLLDAKRREIGVSNLTHITEAEKEKAVRTASIVGSVIDQLDSQAGE